MPSTTDDPVRNLLPQFAGPPLTNPEEPPTLSPDPLSPGPGPAAAVRPIPKGRTRRLLPDDASDGPDGPEYPRQDHPPTPTDTSSPASKPSPAVTAGLIAAAIGMVAVAGAAVVKWRLQRTLRTPTEPQRGSIAAPLARIALRHVDLAWLNKDLADVLTAGNAIGDYVNDGPLLQPLHPDAGVPDNLQETQ